MAEPPVTIRAIHHSGSGNLPPTRIVIHATNPGAPGYAGSSADGQALGTARYFQLERSGGSAHYVVDVAGEQHCLPDDVIAWHAPPNEHSIGIEICAEGGALSVAPKNYSREQWLSPAVWPAVQRAAVRTAELCARFGIPAVRIGPAELVAGRHGVCGHVDVSKAFRQTDHSDPNNDTFPWPEFMAAVTGSPPPSREVDPMTAVPIVMRADGTFRGTLCAESGGGSQVVAQAWLDLGCTWGSAQFRATALGANAAVLATWPEKTPPGTLVRIANNGTAAGIVLPAGTQMVTVEGRVDDPNAGTIPAATVMAKAR